ncbi:MAG: discoidin domain-containing protein [Idiomarina sp.]|nr:discoidin domain-containing protein [Idiomarina sp.]
MRNNLNYFIAILFVCFSLRVLAQPVTQVYVESNESGQGFLVKRLDQCYLITPHHVVGDFIQANVISSTNIRSRGEAYLLQTFGYDLAIMNLTGNITRDCGANLSQIPPQVPSLGNASRLSISSISADGSRYITPVSMTSQDLVWLHVQPESIDDLLFQGMSGSLVFLGTTIVGVLMSVDSNSGFGRVLRIDRTIETILPFFQVGTASSRPSPLLKQSESRQSVAALTPVSWSHQPANLMSVLNMVDDDKSTFWSYLADSNPVTIEFSLGDSVSDIEGLILENYTGNPESFIRDFEIYVTRTATGRRGWNQVYSGTWIRGEEIKQISISPSQARRVMIKIRSDWGGQDGIAISIVKVY